MDAVTNLLNYSYYKLDNYVTISCICIIVFTNCNHGN